MKNFPRIPPILFWIFAGIITVSVGLYFRLYPFYRNVSSDAYEKSTLIVLSRIRASVTEQVNRKFPDMPASQKEQTIQAMFNKVIKEDNARVRKAFDDLGMKILGKEDSGKHYLLESDSYYFLSLTENVLEKGALSPTVKGRHYFNDLMLAPVGYWQPKTWHPYIGAFVYKIIKIFKPNANLMYGVGFTPLFLLPFVVAAFLIACRAMGCSWPAAFTSSIFFVLAPIYLKRSTYAWYRDDSYNFFFPLLSLAFLFFTVRLWEKNKRTAWAALMACAMTITLYTRFWEGWVFLPPLIITGLLVILTKRLILRDNPAADILKILAALFVAITASLLLVYGLSDTIDVITFAWGEFVKFTAPQFKDWPNLFIAVGELKQGSFSEIVEYTGGVLPMLGVIGILIYALIQLIRRKSVDEAIFILFIFLVVTFKMCLNAERFEVLCLTPVSLLFALSLEKLWQERKSISARISPAITPKIVSGCLLCIFLLSFIIPWQKSETCIRSLLNPIFNSTWDRALAKLREETPQNSVIDTWWSPGHFVKAVARRRVSFDGATIRGDIAYWLNRAYLSQTEQEALGILRMLNTSSNNAAQFLQGRGWPLSRAVPFLQQALQLDRNQARALYSSTMTTQEANTLLSMTHGIPPPSYMLIYNEIVDGNVLLGYIGKWDFKKIEALNSNPEALKQIPSKGSKNYMDFLWGLVGGPFRQGTPQAPIGQNSTKLLYPDGITIDTADMSVQIDSRQYGHGIPESIFYSDGNTIQEKKQENATLHYSVIFYQNGNESPRCVLMDRILANSLLMKLYYFEGKGLTHFKPFAKEADLTGRTKIYIYEIKWPESFKR